MNNCTSHTPLIPPEWPDCGLTINKRCVLPQESKALIRDHTLWWIKWKQVGETLMKQNKRKTIFYLRCEVFEDGPFADDEGSDEGVEPGEVGGSLYMEVSVV